MNQQLRQVLMIFSIILIIIPGIVMIVGSERIVIGEQLCVDGNNNINLEGLKCEKSEFISFGMTQRTTTTIQVGLGAIGLLIFAIALFASKGVSDE